MGDQERRMMEDFAKRYDIRFNDPALLKLALTHRSYLHVTGQGPRESNERLEFLGDSVLGLVTSEFLYRSHPGEHEGQLTKTKSLLVSKAILSRRALAMGLGHTVFMSHSEVESGGRQRLSILADAFESVIGAIYLDQGFDAARRFIHRYLLQDSPRIVADKRHTNYKSHLQEYVQSTFRTHPVYRIRSEMGPDHSKQFMVEVMVGRRVLGEGRGRNKKEAEQAAARNALEAVERGPMSDRETRRSERQPRRESATAEAPRVAGPEPEQAPGGAAADDEDDGGPRRRRRGRRGGRGRRERAGPSEAGESPSPPPVGERRERPEPRESLEPRERAESRERGRAPEAVERGRDADRERPISRFTAPPAPPLPPRFTEVEPPPPAHEENDEEEVGRPEGPPGMRHEPAWSQGAGAPPPPRPTPPEPGAPRAPAPFDAPPAPSFADAPEEPALEAEDEEATAERNAGAAREEAGPAAGDEDEEGPRYPEVAPPPSPPPPPSWGRRSRRR
jgi:ribonuclease-3